MIRARWLIGLLLLATVAAGQAGREAPQTPRQFSRAAAKVLARYPRICEHQVTWVVAFDISRSGMGRWNEWSRQIVSDLISYVFVAGDRLVLIPFDAVVDPPRPGLGGAAGFRAWDLTEAGKPQLRAEVAELLLWRGDAPPGTAWVKATRQALAETAKQAKQHPAMAAMTLVISDRDSSDLLQEERALTKSVAGVTEPGQDLWPLPREVKPVVLFHSAATATPTGTASPQRWLPPQEPAAGPTDALLPTPAASPPTRLPLIPWLLAALLAILGLWLLLTGLGSRRTVELRWGGGDDPSRQATVDLPTGESRRLTATVKPSADPFALSANGATNEVQTKMVLEDLGQISADADGLRLRTSDLYLVRRHGEAAWGNQVTVRRGDEPAKLEFRLAAAEWLLLRRPILFEATARGSDWKQRLGLGGAALLAALILFLVARPKPPAATPPPPPGPAVPAGVPTESLCGESGG